MTSFADGLLNFVNPPSPQPGTPVYEDPSLNPTNVPFNNGFYPGPYNSSVAPTSSNTATTSSTPAIDQNLIGLYDQSIGNTQNAYNRTDAQLNSGNSAIDSSYQNALSQLLLGKNQSQNAYDTSSSRALQDYTLAKQQAKQGYDTTSGQALQDYTLGKTNATNAYNTSKQRTAQDYVTSKNTIGANAGASLNSLLRLLGSRGAGGSSAYTQVAPDAVARQATLQRNDVGQTFGRNQQDLDTSYNTGIQNFDTTYGRNKNALDTSYNNGIAGLDTTYGRNTQDLNTNWQNYLTGYDNQVAGAGAQDQQAKTALQNSIDNNRASLLQTLSNLSAQRATAAGGNPVSASQDYLDQANALLDKTANYTTPTINYSTQAYNAPALAAQQLYTPPTLQAQTPYTAPTLASYTVNPNAAPTVNGQPGSASSNYFAPALTALLGKKQTNLAA